MQHGLIVSISKHANSLLETAVLNNCRVRRQKSRSNGWPGKRGDTEFQGNSSIYTFFVFNRKSYIGRRVLLGLSMALTKALENEGDDDTPEVVGLPGSRDKGQFSWLLLSLPSLSTFGRRSRGDTTLAHIYIPTCVTISREMQSHRKAACGWTDATRRPERARLSFCSSRSDGDDGASTEEGGESGKISRPRDQTKWTARFSFLTRFSFSTSGPEKKTDGSEWKGEPDARGGDKRDGKRKSAYGQGGRDTFSIYKYKPYIVPPISAAFCSLSRIGGGCTSARFFLLLAMSSFSRSAAVYINFVIVPQARQRVMRSRCVLWFFFQRIF